MIQVLFLIFLLWKYYSDAIEESAYAAGDESAYAAGEDAIEVVFEQVE